MSVLYAGLVVWFATYVLVESEMFRPLRDAVKRRRDAGLPVRTSRTYVNQRAYEEYNYAVELYVGSRRYRRWEKLRYLLGCHACAGTWVGFAVAAALPGVRPLGGGAVGFVLAGLLFKAVGHLALVAHKLGESLANR